MIKEKVRTQNPQKRRPREDKSKFKIKMKIRQQLLWKEIEALIGL